jgi:hypothetical protein
VVVVMMACVIVAVRPMMMGGSISVANLRVLGHEIVGSIAVGTSLGLALAVYLRLVGKNLLLVLVALGFGPTELMRYIHIDPLLSFLTAGFVGQNLSLQGRQAPPRRRAGERAAPWSYASCTCSIHSRMLARRNDCQSHSGALG